MADNVPKRKRGRPKKVKAKLPEFTSEKEIRKYILDSTLELTLELKEIATKKNNIKKPSVSNAKNQQYKTALTSLKVANEILKDLQINKIEEQVKLIEDGLILSSEDIAKQPSADTLEKIEKLAEITEKLAEI